jgi:hypothetical protein
MIECAKRDPPIVVGVWLEEGRLGDRGKPR